MCFRISSNLTHLICHRIFNLLYVSVIFKLLSPKQHMMSAKVTANEGLSCEVLGIKENIGLIFIWNYHNNTSGLKFNADSAIPGNYPRLLLIYW